MITNNFAPRHNGVSKEAEVEKMLKVIGVGSMDELIDKTVPAAIRTGKPLPLPDGIKTFVAYIDAYGNADLNLSYEDFERERRGRPFKVMVQDQVLTEVVRSYVDARASGNARAAASSRWPSERVRPSNSSTCVPRTASPSASQSNSLSLS